MNQAVSGPSTSDPAALSPEQYEAVAAQVFKAIERTVTERAIATGLIVGVSSNPRLDALTIVLAAFEIQMHVLTELGKKPGLRTWINLVQRCGASLFWNTYLNRGECLSLSVGIKQAGIGVQAASELVGQGADLIGELDMDELSDILGDGAPEYVNLALWAGATVTGAGLGAGRVALRIVGEAIEKIGDDLLQGVLAGATLYFHGMALAADCLALDQSHRRCPEMTRTVRDGVKSVATVASGLLRDQVRCRTEAYRTRRRQAVTQAPKMLGGRIWNSLRSSLPTRAKGATANGGASR
jgi:hypothetical protein